MDAHTLFATFAENLIETKVAHVWRGHGSALFLELGNLTPRTRRDGTPGDPKGEVTICIEWSWRIENDTAIICGSWSDEELWESSFDQLRQQRVKKLELFGRLPEIELTLDGGNRLLSFSTTDGQPQWYVTDHRTLPHRWFSTRDGVLHLGDGTET
ncbi:hypothetical protein [Sphingorhabdus sp. Alg231-15]|uniref:hypothetical protein n=1 Tax=Sphingorhabdus sp. Alg231-15 TaxID=1922222 RepID=UPI000D55150D